MRIVIDGLKLTLSGEKIRSLLDERMRGHERCAQHWKRELARTPEDQTEDEPLLPDEICENAAERHEWRIEVLAFIREHVEPAETYRLGEADLKFGELLPDKPGWMEQQEYEQETGVAFNLERLTKEVRGLSLSGRYALAEHMTREVHRETGQTGCIPAAEAPPVMAMQTEAPEAARPGSRAPSRV